ncbi:hypothetical protein [Planomonospora sp. ID67723]|uniref:hypothetical protein n=1 Tax=Planomonospora sp. ID67723 TaxID=2738134 RepID=UPI001E602ADF|nr:hypothetical protein [Planomonospora sp. ID67723]
MVTISLKCAKASRPAGRPEEIVLQPCSAFQNLMVPSVILHIARRVAGERQ